MQAPPPYVGINRNHVTVERSDKEGSQIMVSVLKRSPKEIRSFQLTSEIHLCQITSSQTQHTWIH